LRSTSNGTPAFCRSTCCVTSVWRCDFTGLIWLIPFKLALASVGCGLEAVSISWKGCKHSDAYILRLLVDKDQARAKGGKV